MIHVSFRGGVCAVRDYMKHKEKCEGSEHLYFTCRGLRNINLDMCALTDGS